MTQKMMINLDKELDVENIRKHSEMVFASITLPMQKV